MESAPTTSAATPIARLRWLMVASLGLGLAIAAPLIDKVAWGMAPPEVVQWIGRFHPLVLHFPIVLLLLALVFEAARLPVLRRLLPRPDAATVTVILAWGAAGCTLAGGCGWLLAQSGGYEKELLDHHLWAGAATAVGANLALIFRLASSHIGTGTLNAVSNATLTITCGVMAVAGHYGASLTHGETYLTEHAPDVVRKLIGLKPKLDPNALVIKPAERRLLWDDVVQPIFEERCNSCHNEGKMKGGLRLDSLAGVLKGGASGAAVAPGNPKDSLVLQLLHLDLDDAKHMPPKGKPQPTEEQIAVLHFWIENGAPGDKTAGDFELTAAVRAALDAQITPSQRKALEAKTRAEAAALETALATLRCRLPGRLSCVVPGQPELEYAPGLHAAEVGDAELNALAPVAGSVVALELQQTRVTDAGLAALAPFGKLRNIQLQNTALSDAGLVHLGKVASLEVVNLYGTGVTDAGLQHLAPLQHLKKVYLWQSKVTEAGASQLRTAVPGVDIDLGLPAIPQPMPAAGKDSPANPAASNPP
jgi:uncharacterized membrane protein